MCKQGILIREHFISRRFDASTFTMMTGYSLSLLPRAVSMELSFEILSWRSSVQPQL